MRLSEAILLGSSLLKPSCGQFETVDGSGCALGMANKAIGGKGTIRRDSRLEREWPWLQRTAIQKLPCGCIGERLMGAGGMHNNSARGLASSVWCATVHLFNQHVCDGSWTIEQLADWVRSVEPPESVPAAEPAVAEAMAVAP